jgi:hypothetical protein
VAAVVEEAVTAPAAVLVKPDDLFRVVDGVGNRGGAASDIDCLVVAPVVEKAGW